MQPPAPPAAIDHQPGVSAVAVGSLWSNAVGTVALRCLPDRLRIDLLRVSRFQAGFALIGAASPVRFEVPYRAVRALVRSGPLLVLALDPRVARPYQRFALCRFSDAPHESMLGAFRLVAALRLVRTLLPLVVAALAWWSLPEAWVAGLVGRAAAAALSGWLAWALARPLIGLAAGGGPRSRLLRVRFEQALCERLGLEPAAGLVAPPRALASASELAGPSVPEPSTELQGAIRSAWGVAARPRALAVVGGLGLLALLGAVLAVERVGVVESVVLPVDDGRVGVASAVRARATAAGTAVDTRHEACSCERTASALWDGGLPVLSIIVAPRRGAIEPLWLRPGATVPVLHSSAKPAPVGEDGAQGVTPRADRADEPPQRGKRKRRRSRGSAAEVELDLAVVNNGARALEDVSLVVTFAQRNEQGARMAVMERGLAWPRPLEPGEAVKWRIEAEGTELRVDCRFDELLGAEPVASADRFRKLLEARLTPVRVHAAMMLAYLGDPHAREAATALGPLTTREEQVRAEILRTQTPLRACAIAHEGGAAQLCVHNGGDELLRAVRLTPAGLGRDGTEPGWTVVDFFRPGAALGVEIPAGVAPGGFDVRGETTADHPSPSPMVPVGP